MEMQLFVFGTPKGESFWGNISSEQPYFSTYYNSCTDRLKFVIEGRKVNGKTYYYYNYLIYSDVIDCDNRSGAFFGLSLRFDEYYSDYITIYRCLDWVFKYHILGRFLKDNGNKLKYVIKSFADEHDNMKAIENSIVNYLNLTLAPNRFKKLPIVSGSVSLKRMNIPEANDYQVSDALSKGGKVELSPYYMTEASAKIAKEFESKAAIINQTLNKCIQEKESLTVRNKSLSSDLTRSMDEVQDCRNQIRALNQGSQALHKELAELKNLKLKVHDLQHELLRYKNNIDIKSAIDTIKTPINKLADYFGNVASIKSDGQEAVLKPRYKRYIKLVIRLFSIVYKVLVLVMLGVLFHQLANCSGHDCGKEEVESTSAQIAADFVQTVKNESTKDN